MNGKTNGKANGHAATSLAGGKDDGGSPPPGVIRDLAEACVRFVQRAVGFELDFEPETLPVLDHYVEHARKETRDRRESRPLVAQAIGAYLGEVVRRKFRGFWRLEDENEPRSWRVELEPVYLILRPIELIERALDLPPDPGRDASPGVERNKDKDDDEEEDKDGDEALADAVGADAASLDALHDPAEDLGPALLELDEDDRADIAARLASLPPVSDTEYHAPSTQLEIVEIVVEALRARRMAAGMEADAQLEPDDYS